MNNNANSDADSGNPLSSSSRLESDSGGGVHGGSVGGARYKLMPPAKLPFSRLPGITIPPGLSPMSFVESYVISQVKAEPSPTTVSSAKPHTEHSSPGFNSYSATTVPSNVVGEIKSSCFDFRPNARSDLVPADMHHCITEQSVQMQGHCQIQSLASSTRVKNEKAVPSKESSLSAPLPSSGNSAPTEVDSDEFRQIGISNSGPQASQSDYKEGNDISMSSDDGFNWRKYGQKHVKGSEFPRSYYRCTHPNCEVKKLFECSHDGQIIEIIYRGTHDHPKPQSSRRYFSDVVLSIPEDRSDKVLSLSNQNVKPHGTLELCPVTPNDDCINAAEDGDPHSKRRKMDNRSVEVIQVVKPLREPRVVVQTMSEVDILEDGYRWRKYGQKVVRGNPNPRKKLLSSHGLNDGLSDVMTLYNERSYYKCTNAGCPVRKHVERASHDPKAVLTTYEGKHDHDLPASRTINHDKAGSSATNGLSRIRSDESEIISLDLGVGINSSTKNRSKLDYAKLPRIEDQTSGFSFRLVSSTAVPYYGVLNVGMNQYGSRQNPTQGCSVKVPP